MTQQDPPGLDLARLRAHLDEQAPGLVAGPLTGQVVEGGRSNLTYLVSDGRSRWVVRRPPLGHVLPTAHDMAREHRVISALRGTPVPVPATVTLCQDTGVLGASFYVMAFVDGTPYRSAAELEVLGPERTAGIANALVDTLVDLHAVDPEAVGLADFGRPEGFLERQLRRWKKQLDASRSRDIEGVDRLHERLARHLPASGAPAIVHGDYRLDNVLVNGEDRITAVLDWEMSTLGDPLTDLALLVAYAERGKIDLSIVSNVSTAPGYPTTDEVVARYASRSGRDISALNWYVGFAFFKLAVILEGIYYRFSQGQTVGAGFDQIGEAVGPLVALGNETLKD
ncbi:aminoglycoside phosphotransferase (APT) family kinase protein [Amycolatopsis bartoniae]|uniref:Acyl-CoA dehydrogenase n=1 Tax=Amycolatopsis bartoniae TaxID=941986 RepID=A0A8H9INZ3_9PSEU|nr:phosphotransferase family protein [Amycolatopsis bartoniae]MBB2939278.1 aminoglycoside phosphotransferase (APT) family kinase protein [Amycolatopsis bartoniae]TVT08734.1 phosphotransferase family protein [Amycolatopsis bartoniae]GHF37629.1 acyl-CoA dehydrogenase [Amycolatopsis bartoniae]